MQEPKNEITRREVLKTSVAGIALTSAGCKSMYKTSLNPGNSVFYTSTGAFNQKAAKEAYLAMMRTFNYPILDVFKTDQFWVCDFLQKDFAHLGMGGIFWINTKGVFGESGAKNYKGEFKDKKFGYLGHDIFLLPGQLLPEHHHIGGPEGYPPKMESWLVRHGTVDFFGEYKDAGDEILISEMAKGDKLWGSDEPWFKSKYVATRTSQSGKIYMQNNPESWHGQRAGACGAIVSEFATYHNHVSFSKPGMEFKNTEA